jgi:signal transduction histidine kinase/DNA-binding NarL/FixJ family response regulator
MSAVRVAQLRVVIADDALDLRAMVSRTLTVDGRFAVVAEAGDGAGAIAQVLHHRPDVLVLDLSLPDLEGFEVLRRIQVEAPEVHVVVLSGFRASELAADALALGAAAYVEKGVSLDTLTEVVAAAAAEERSSPRIHTAAPAPLAPSRPTPEAQPGRPRSSGAAPAEDAPPGRGERLRPSLVFLAVVLATIATLSFVQAGARDAEVVNFVESTEVAAAVVSNEMTGLVRQLTLTSPAILGEAPGPGDVAGLRDVLAARGVVVLDEDGIATMSSNPAIIGRDLGAEYAHVRAARDGGVGVSDVIPSASNSDPIFAVAVALGDGRLVSASFDVGTDRLVRQLEDAAPPQTTAIWIVDAAGQPVAATFRSLEVAEVLGGVPTAALLAGTPIDGWVVAEEPVAGTSWRVLAATPSLVLTAEIDGLATALPWAMLALLAAAGVLALSLHRRSLQQARTLAATNEELARSNEDLEQFAYVASHDLQEPLRKVASYCQLLERRYVGRLDDQADTYIAHAVDGATRMQQLIGDLLRFARAGRAEVTGPGPVELVPALEQAVEAVTARIEATGATVNLPMTAPDVAVDPMQVTQVVQNLLANALRFHRPATPPVITLRATAQAGMVHLEVEDDGIGIAPDQLEQVFGVFQQLHHRSAYGGTGIGLAIVRRTVERAGGRVWATAKPGPGATFHVLLPTATRASR